MVLRVVAGVARRRLSGASARRGWGFGVGVSGAIVASAAFAMSVLAGGCAEASGDAGSGDDDLVEGQVGTTQSALFTPPADAWNPPPAPPQWPLKLKLPKPMTFTFDATEWVGAYTMFYCPSPGYEDRTYTDPVDGRQGGNTFSARWSDIVALTIYPTFVERQYCADGPPPEIGSGGFSNRQSYLVEGITSKGERLTTGGRWNSPVERPSGRPGWAYMKRSQMKIERMELDGKPMYLQSINAGGTRQVPHYQEGSMFYVGPRPFREEIASCDPAMIAACIMQLCLNCGAMQPGAPPQLRDASNGTGPIHRPAPMIIQKDRYETRPPGGV